MVMGGWLISHCRGRGEAGNLPHCLVFISYIIIMDDKFILSSIHFSIICLMMVTNNDMEMIAIKIIMPSVYSPCPGWAACNMPPRLNRAMTEYSWPAQCVCDSDPVLQKNCDSDLILTKYSYCVCWRRRTSDKPMRQTFNLKPPRKPPCDPTYMIVMMKLYWYPSYGPNVEAVLCVCKSVSHQWLDNSFSGEGSFRVSHVTLYYYY